MFFWWMLEGSGRGGNYREVYYWVRKSRMMRWNGG